LPWLSRFIGGIRPLLDSRERAFRRPSSCVPLAGKTEEEEKTMPHEVESMFYVGKEPWHRLGRRLPDVTTWEAAVVAAGLDWEVRLEPLFVSPGDTLTQIDEAVATVRRSDHSVLGVVSPRYEIVQNRDAFRFLDDILDDSRPKYETAGALRGGRRVWALARLPGEIKVAGIDEVAPYLLLVNAHDGSHSLMVAVTPVRVVCMNTLNMAIRGAAREWRTRHYGDVAARVQQARQTLGIAWRYLESFEQIAERLCEITLTDGEVEDFARNVIFAGKPGDTPVPKWAQKRRKELVGLVHILPDLQPFRGTAWAAYNAAAYLNDHRLRTRSADRRLERVWFDTGIKDRALDYLLAL
jgi:phage/plasmid-like protein (TIGR03299 family)